MAGITGLGLGGITPQPNRKDVGGIKKEETPPILGDNVTLGGASTTNGVDAASAIRAARAVNIEQPFSADWAKTFLNGPGNMGDGFKTVSGENLGTQPHEDVGHGVHGFSIPQPGRPEIIFWDDGTTPLGNSSDVVSHELGHQMLTQMDWNISK